MTHIFLSRAGGIAIITGLLGALSAVLLLAWPPQVAEGVVSYPFTATGFQIAQGWFFVHHFGFVPALMALAVSGAAGNGRFTRVGAWTAAVGMVALSLAELLAMRYADWGDDAANAGLMGSAYGTSVTLIGLGMLVAGVGVLRASLWKGWRRWTPLAIGIATFAVVTPGMFGGFVIARLAIGFWMLLFAALGWSLHTEAEHLSPAGPSRAGEPAHLPTR